MVLLPPLFFLLCLHLFLKPPLSPLVSLSSTSLHSCSCNPSHKTELTSLHTRLRNEPHTSHIHTLRNTYGALAHLRTNSHNTTHTHTHTHRAFLCGPPHAHSASDWLLGDSLARHRTVVAGNMHRAHMRTHSTCVCTAQLHMHSTYAYAHMHRARFFLRSLNNIAFIHAYIQQQEQRAAAQQAYQQQLQQQHQSYLQQQQQHSVFRRSNFALT